MRSIGLFARHSTLSLVGEVYLLLAQILNFTGKNLSDESAMSLVGAIEEMTACLLERKKRNMNFLTVSTEFFDIEVLDRDATRFERFKKKREKRRLTTV
jgi:hypothetical protein